MTIVIKGQRYKVLSIVDTVKRYGERVISSTHSGDTMMNPLETEWIYHHGAPEALARIRNFAKGSSSTSCQRTLFKHTPDHRDDLQIWKSGNKQRCFKAVLNRPLLKKTKESAATIVSRASFMNNVFQRSSIPRAFQFSRRYSPSLLRIPSTVVLEELLNSHIESTAHRAIRKIWRSKCLDTIRVQYQVHGTRVWAFYTSSKHIEPVRWISASVIKANTHVVRSLRSNRGRTLTVAY